MNLTFRAWVNRLQQRRLERLKERAEKTGRDLADAKLRADITEDVSALLSAQMKAIANTMIYVDVNKTMQMLTAEVNRRFNAYKRAEAETQAESDLMDRLGAPPR